MTRELFLQNKLLRIFYNSDCDHIRHNMCSLSDISIGVFEKMKNCSDFTQGWHKA